MATSQQAANTQVMTGADILVQSLVDHGVEVIFAYPGGASMPLHQALTRYGDQIRTILPRHEQGGGFAAQGYARTTGKVGVCMATSGPGATNLVTAIADAKLDSIPLIAITGQVRHHGHRHRRVSGDADRRGLPRHHQASLPGDRRPATLPRVMKEAFHIATTGRPGPVLIDMPKDVQLRPCVPDWDAPMNLPGYRLEAAARTPEQIDQVAAAIKLAKRPVIYAGGGIISADASDELRELRPQDGHPRDHDRDGTGRVSRRRSPARSTCSACTAASTPTTRSTIAICCWRLGVRFDDRVTGKVEEFAKHAKIVHIDIDRVGDQQEQGSAHLPIVQRREIRAPGAEQDRRAAGQTSPTGSQQCQAVEAGSIRSRTTTDFDGILQQHAIDELSRLTADRDTDRHRRRRPASDVGGPVLQVQPAPHAGCPVRGLGTMGFGLPAAMGAAGRSSRTRW